MNAFTNYWGGPTKPTRAYSLKNKSKILKSTTAYKQKISKINLTKEQEKNIELFSKKLLDNYLI